jgi:predicted metalloprotease with PDZ domain
MFVNSNIMGSNTDGEHPLVRFHVSLKDTCGHRYHVKCTIEKKGEAPLKFSMPTWIPGSYLLREYAKDIVELTATSSSGASIVCSKIDKCTWVCEASEGTVTIEYSVYAFDPSVRAAYLDQFQGFFNGTSLFIRPEIDDARFEVTLENDSGQPSWRAHTAFTPLHVDPQSGFGTYVAGDYEELIDHPVLLGPFEAHDFEVCGTPHRLVIAGKHSADVPRFISDIAKVCDSQIKLFGGQAPFSRYLFMLKAEDEGYGGLEHRSSCAMICKRSDLPSLHDTHMSPAYCTLLGLVSHEYFHAWNVKRIRPKALLPLNFRDESYTQLLWVFEGITSYYDDLMLVRSGVIGVQTYLELLAKNLTKLWRTAGRTKQALADASFDTWIKFYRPNENSHNSTVSYYIKGSVVALLLDARVRHATGGKQSLDDIMRALWQRFGSPAGKLAGLGEHDFETVAETVTGLSLKDFFDQAVRGTDELPVQELLARLGIDSHLRPAEHDRDEGGSKNKKTFEELEQQATLHARLRKESEHHIRIAQVDEGGTAQLAGLWAGDELIAINDMRVTASGFEALIAAFKVGETATVQAVRRGTLFSAQLRFVPKKMDTWWLTVEENASEKRKALRAAWLGIA